MKKKANKVTRTDIKSRPILNILETPGILNALYLSYIMNANMVH